MSVTAIVETMALYPSDLGRFDLAPLRALQKEVLSCSLGFALVGKLHPSSFFVRWPVNRFCRGAMKSKLGLSVEEQIEMDRLLVENDQDKSVRFIFKLMERRGVILENLNEAKKNFSYYRH